MRRRDFIGRAAAALAAGALSGRASAAPGWSEDLAGALEKIEARSGGRLGVALLDVRSGAQAGHRVDERFPMCSTFKLLAVAAVLQRVDAAAEQLSRRIRFEPSDLVTYSPVTGKRAGGEGMTVEELCDAAITVSDNTAGNLLLASIGGPAGLTAFARSLADPVTRLDRIEPELNEAAPGDPRDTTTPRAMASDLRALVFGSALSSSSRDRLVAWLKRNSTGDRRLRAGLPAPWTVGDKTGTGRRGTMNDVAIVWPSGRPPFLVAAYLTGSTEAGEDRDAALAAVARAAAQALRT